MDIDKLTGADREELLADIANQYYNLGKNQSEIAACYQTSRFKISKLLQDARNEQIVEIRIKSAHETSAVLEKELMSAFPLQNAIVVDTQYSPYIDSLRLIGEVGAAYMNQILTPDSVLGITWGKTIYSVLSRLQTVSQKNITTVQITGNFKQANPSTDSRALVPMVASAYNGAYHYMDAPIYVKDPALKNALLAEPGISQTLAVTQNLTTVITGIGGKSSLPIVNPVFAPYVTPEDLKKEADCPGSIYGYVLDQHGQIAEIPLNQKVIATPLETILRARHRLAVVCGRHKAAITALAIGQNLINEILTDTDTAQTLLHHASHGNGTV